MRGKRRWHFGRRVALVYILCTCVGILVAELFAISPFVALGVSTVAFVTIWVAMSIGEYFRRVQLRSNQQAKNSRNVKANPSTSLSVASDDKPLVSTQVQSDRIKNRVSESDYIDVKTSAEHELELDLATAHIAPDLTDFDQSIVEAEFQAVYGAEKLDDNFASPNFEAEDVNTAEGHFSDLSEHRITDSSDASSYVQDILNEISDGARDELNNDDVDAGGSVENIAIVKRQHAQLELLREKNQQLEVTKESLIGEVAKLKVHVKNSEATARKNEAAKEHALLLKNKALQIAALERKKRRMTEVKARKIILKLRRNMELLEVDSVE